MRSVLTIWAALGCAVLLGACDILPHAMTATTVGFEVLEFSRQTQFPGVESNLYATEVHRVKLNGNFTEGAQRFELWVDSVALPSLIQDCGGDGHGARPSHDVRFTANRQIPKAPQVPWWPEETYRLTGEVPEGQRRLCSPTDGGTKLVGTLVPESCPTFTPRDLPSHTPCHSIFKIRLFVLGLTSDACSRSR